MAHGRKKPRQPRILRNPIEHAMWSATALTTAESRSTLAPAKECMHRLREGTATEDHHTVLYTILSIAKDIEKSGIVRGLAEHIDSALRSMDAIRARSTANGAWHPTALYWNELAAIDEAVDLHAFQLRQVSAGELHSIAKKLIARHQSSGGVFQRSTAHELGLGRNEKTKSGASA